jgi:hypothetical protein
MSLWVGEAVTRCRRGVDPRSLHLGRQDSNRYAQQNLARPRLHSGVHGPRMSPRVGSARQSELLYKLTSLRHLKLPVVSSIRWPAPISRALIFVSIALLHGYA